jgi:hypothetical protein
MAIGYPGLVNVFAVVMVVVFATGALCGFFVTAFWIPDPANWWLPALIRVAWQLGGAVLFGLSVALANEPARGGWRVVAGVAAVGLLLAHNPLLDLIRGPTHVRGLLTANIHDSSDSIYATVTVRADDGTVTRLDLAGWPVSAFQDSLTACHRQPAELTALRHLDIILALSCDHSRGSR